jgi:hypothetical protein
MGQLRGISASRAKTPSDQGGVDGLVLVTVRMAEVVASCPICPHVD